MNVNWTVRSNKKVDEQARKLSERVMLKLRFLIMDLSSKGPAAPDWPNYGKLKGKIVILGIAIYRKGSLRTYVVGK